MWNRRIEEGHVDLSEDDLEEQTWLSDISAVPPPPSLDELSSTEEEFNQLMMSRETQEDMAKHVCIDEFAQSIYACSKRKTTGKGQIYDVDSEACIKYRGKFGYCIHANFFRRTSLYYCPLQIRKFSECCEQYPSTDHGPHPQCAMSHWKMEECISAAHMKEREQFRKNVERTIDHSVGVMVSDAFESGGVGAWSLWFLKNFANPEFLSRDWQHHTPKVTEHWKDVFN